MVLALVLIGVFLFFALVKWLRGLRIRPGHVLRSHLYGVQRRNSGRTSRQTAIKRCRVGEKLVLEREPDNPHDPYAINVFTQSGEQIGYLSTQISSEYSRSLARGERINVEIAGFTGGLPNAPMRGVDILITAYSASAT